MKIFWSNYGEGIESANAKETSLEEAQLIWSDYVDGDEGNFLGLIDENKQVIQFYYTESIPDHIEDAEHLEIVDLDFPAPSKRGSYVSKVQIGDVQKLIEKAFQVGANPENFDKLTFQAW